jgi:hypothetical protein
MPVPIVSRQTTERLQCCKRRTQLVVAHQGAQRRQQPFTLDLLGALLGPLRGHCGPLCLQFCRVCFALCAIAIWQRSLGRHAGQDVLWRGQVWWQGAGVGGAASLLRGQASLAGGVCSERGELRCTCAFAIMRARISPLNRSKRAFGGGAVGDAAQQWAAIGTGGRENEVLQGLRTQWKSSAGVGAPMFRRGSGVVPAEMFRVGCDGQARITAPKQADGPTKVSVSCSLARKIRQMHLDSCL